MHHESPEKHKKPKTRATIRVSKQTNRIRRKTFNKGFSILYPGKMLT